MAALLTDGPPPSQIEQAWHAAVALTADLETLDNMFLELAANAGRRSVRVASAAGLNDISTLLMLLTNAIQLISLPGVGR